MVDLSSWDEQFIVHSRIKPAGCRNYLSQLDDFGERRGIGRVINKTGYITSSVVQKKTRGLPFDLTQLQRNKQIEKSLKKWSQ